MNIKTDYYQQFDADPGLDIPGEGYGGWKSADLEIDPSRTALVSMHAWTTGTREIYPGWYRAVEYIPRARRIQESVFPRLLSAVRGSRMKVFHVVGGGDYYKDYPGYKRALTLAGEESEEPKRIEPDQTLNLLHQFRKEHVSPGLHNVFDIDCGFKGLDFSSEGKPEGEEGIAENAHQLFALCRQEGINHLIYIGFAVNWCLLMSPGGMLDMSRRGVMCSAIRQAVTAVENKESAREEWGKDLGLWRVALAFGFVYDLDNFIFALEQDKKRNPY
jgi:hypothetical protein